MLDGACFCTILQNMHEGSKDKTKSPNFFVLCNQFIFFALHISFTELRGLFMTDLENKVLEEVGKVLDPETGQSFAEMQMIQSVKETETGIVTVEFVPTSPFCPIAFKLAAFCRRAVHTRAFEYMLLHLIRTAINKRRNTFNNMKRRVSL